MCCLIWRMLAKLSYSVRKMLFYEALRCSRTLETVDPILILIDPFFSKKIHSHDFWLWTLFYQLNWEISRLVKRNNHLKGKKIYRKMY